MAGSNIKGRGDFIYTGKAEKIFVDISDQWGKALINRAFSSDSAAL